MSHVQRTQQRRHVPLAVILTGHKKEKKKVQGRSKPPSSHPCVEPRCNKTARLFPLTRYLLFYIYIYIVTHIYIYIAFQFCWVYNTIHIVFQYNIDIYLPHTYSVPSANSTQRYFHMRHKSVNDHTYINIKCTMYINTIQIHSIDPYTVYVVGALKMVRKYMPHV